ncbi:MAG TPA: PHP domain-containing protein [Candidatus Omnitrophota bacterium]|nr:PHP domain-containing protein [Candidatus Omnitrophota bacterium]HRZ66938.1 PHP domain-containing protein [Candidatus Omnitrophota bacterium]
MEKLADLHVHTRLSDGTFTPAEVVEGAKKAGLSCIAITDHDCVDAIAPARKAARGKGIEIIPGVEMTAQEKSREVHILGYYPDIEDARFLRKLKAIRQNRVDRAYKIIEKLRKYDIFLDPEAVFKLSGPGSVGRMHIASALEERGYVSSIKEAFNRYIGDKGPCYVAHYEIKAKDAIAELKRVGAVVVFAHPQLMGGEDLIPKFVKYGLDGLEAFHSEQSRSVARKFSEIAAENGLLVTGGSDCHGLNKGRMLMGTVMVPYGLVEGLKRCAKRIKNI